MTAPPSAADLKPFASTLGIAPEDLPAVGAMFASVLDKVGVDGKAIFGRLCEGKPLAAALGAPPEAVSILYARAHSWFAIGRPDKAAILFAGLCALAGGVADHWAGLGVALKAQGRCAEAVRALTTASEVRPEWALPYVHLTECFMRLGDKARARAALSDFEARVDGAIPESLRAEAARYHAILMTPEAAVSAEA